VVILSAASLWVINMTHPVFADAAERPGKLLRQLCLYLRRQHRP
jgi:hypothetical protein